MTPEERRERYAAMLVDAMEQKMRVGREKYGDSWTEADTEYLWRRMQEEVFEFRQAVEHDHDAEEAVAELADIVNFGTMYLTRYLDE